MLQNHQVKYSRRVFIRAKSEPDYFKTLIRERYKRKVWKNKLHKVIFECFHQCQEWGYFRCENINIERQWVAHWEVLLKDPLTHELMENSIKQRSCLLESTQNVSIGADNKCIWVWRNLLENMRNNFSWEWLLISSQNLWKVDRNFTNSFHPQSSNLFLLFEG